MTRNLRVLKLVAGGALLLALATYWIWIAPVWSEGGAAAWVSFDLESSGAGRIQAYFEDGRGYREELSSTAPVRQGEQRISLPMPAPKIVAIRIDPLDAEGTFKIRKLIVGCNRCSQDLVVPLDTARPLNQVARMTAENGAIELSTVAGANDPYIELPFRFDLSQHNAIPVGPIVAMVLLVLVAGLAGSRLIVTPLGKHAAAVFAGGGSRMDAARRTTILIGVIFAASLWLRLGFPIYAIAGAGHDDLLFVRLAAAMSKGDWLGAYNNLTHIKGIGFPLFLALNKSSGLPLKLTEHLFYLAASLYLALTLGHFLHSRGFVLATFAVLAFTPLAWNPDVGGRVVREGFYIPLTMLLIALSLRCFVASVRDDIADDFKAKWPLLMALGLCGGVFWVTREEGIWLAPALAIPMSYWLLKQAPWRSARPSIFIRRSALFFGLPFVVFLAVAGVVGAANNYVYGVFRNNDFRSEDFLSAYGAVSRIKPEHWQRYVVFSTDAREKAYAMSAAARELRPSLEGNMGKSWREASCGLLPAIPCKEIFSSHFVWAFRDAVAAAGYYRSATAAQSFYRRLAAEIDEGCKATPGLCLAPRETMAPPWQWHYLGDTAAAAWEVTLTLASLGNGRVHSRPSEGPDVEFKLFEQMTNSAVAPRAAEGQALQQAYGVKASSPMRERIARLLFWPEFAVVAIGIPLSILVWLFLLPRLGRNGDSHESFVVLTVLLAAVATRIALLAFMQISSIPSANNILYVSPAVPMALALLPCAVAAAFMAFRLRHQSATRMAYSEIN